MSKFKRQPEQQQQQSLASYQCPGCKQPMRLVGRESVPGNPAAELLTFQCACGQVATATSGN